MSKRKRTEKVPHVPDDSIQFAMRAAAWTVKDKMILYDALNKYGHKDIENIWSMLPHKTKGSLRIMINKLMRKAKLMFNEHAETLDTWFNSGLFADQTYPIPEVLKFIALFEKHPTVEESAGFDFKSAYEYLYQMSLGHPITGIPEKTLEEMHNLMKEIRKKVWPANQNNILGYLGSLENRKHAKKCYPPKKKQVVRLNPTAVWIKGSPD